MKSQSANIVLDDICEQSFLSLAAKCQHPSMLPCAQAASLPIQQLREVTTKYQPFGQYHIISGNELRTLSLESMTPPCRMKRSQKPSLCGSSSYSDSVKDHLRLEHTAEGVLDSMTR